jgi:NAD(P)-dependent dehydrogenase (short-subunit alcohol dehydrogenase family)
MKAACIIVTGPTSGIGKEIASQLASRGAEVILACRDAERGQQTAKEIAEHAAAAAQPAVIPVDTSSQASIREFAREFRQRYEGLDVLVNNAGVLCPQRSMSRSSLVIR